MDNKPSLNHVAVSSGMSIAEVNEVNISLVTRICCLLLRITSVANLHPILPGTAVVDWVNISTSSFFNDEQS